MLAKTLMFASLLTPLVFTTPVVAESASLFSVSSASVQSSENAAKININQATAEQLARALHGVGMARARAIVELREQLGGFKDIEDLLQVRGLGVKVLEDNKERIEL